MTAEEWANLKNGQVLRRQTPGNNGALYLMVSGGSPKLDTLTCTVLLDDRGEHVAPRRSTGDSEWQARVEACDWYEVIE